MVVPAGQVSGAARGVSQLELALLPGEPVTSEGLPAGAGSGCGLWPRCAVHEVPAVVTDISSDRPPSSATHCQVEEGEPLATVTHLVSHLLRETRMPAMSAAYLFWGQSAGFARAVGR